jgi:hypothetical protein
MINADIVKIFASVGMGGAGLFLLYHFGNRFFTYLEKRASKDGKIDKLFEKMDKLIEAFYVTFNRTGDIMTSTTKTQELMKDTIDLQFNLLQEINGKLGKIEVRTSKKEGKNNE